MEKLTLLTTLDLGKITNHRIGEKKFGDTMLTVPIGTTVATFLKECDAKFVLVGIPEDIGVRANFGRAGTSSAWNSALKGISNLQHNRFCKGSYIVALGKIDVDQEMEEAKNLDASNEKDKKILMNLVAKIDKEVAHVVYTIVKAGKIPIIIGGGHNNAYGNIKGTALAKGKAINAINFDAHSDFRIMEGRHSGNGFSYAFDENFLNKYFIFGLHESYTSKNVLDRLKKLSSNIRYNTYDEIGISKQKNFEQELFQALNFIKDTPFGIEIDLDALPNVASSAMTMTGFSIEQLRHFIYHMSQHPNASYLHICEGAPSLDVETNNHLVGKLIAYLVTDFIKSKKIALKKEL